MPVFRFACACGWSGDRLAEARDETDACPACGGRAARRFSPPQMLVIRVVGVDSIPPDELASRLENKASIEARADEVHSGAISLRTRSTVPRELRPDIPRRFH